MPDVRNRSGVGRLPTPTRGLMACLFSDPAVIIEGGARKLRTLQGGGLKGSEGGFGEDCNLSAHGRGPGIRLRCGKQRHT
jgi:hypothetical protein